MKLISLDCSTTIASIALLEDTRVVVSAERSEDRARHEGLYEVLSPLMEKAGWGWSDIECYVVGRGPGAYSGLRVSLLAAQALAAPSQTPVIAVSSMEAMARDILHRSSWQEVTVVGDARRNSFWVGRCPKDHDLATAVIWDVVTAGDLLPRLQAAESIITPHWEALAAIRSATPTANWQSGPHRPTAEHVAHLALARQAAGFPTDALSPLYLHAAV